MTLQEIFNKGVGGVLAQGKRAVQLTPFPHCVYRLQEGDKVLKCVIGHCIPDELYHTALEGAAVEHMIWVVLFPSDYRLDEDLELAKVARPILGSLCPGWERDGIARDFLKDIQRAHDLGGEQITLGQFLDRAKRVAERYYLEFPEEFEVARLALAPTPQ